MSMSQTALSRVNALATIVVVIVSFLLPSAIYSISTYTNLSADMSADTHFIVDAIRPIITRYPQTWTSKRAEIKALASHHLYEQGHGHEQISVIDEHGVVVLMLGNPPSSPVTTRTLTLTEAGKVVGSVRLQRSLRNIVINTGLMFLLGLVLAVASFLTLRFIPLRSRKRADEVLRARDRSLVFANTVLTAATEGSLDAILIVNEKTRIVSYNRRFVDMWRIPREVMEAGNHEPVLATVQSRTSNPDAFAARVRYLYAHPEEESMDRIETLDGRIIERYSRTLYGTGHEYLGRVWFFRDVTEQERAEDKIKFANTLLQAEIESAPDGVFVVHSDPPDLSFNRNFLEMWSITPEVQHSRDSEKVLEAMLPQVEDSDAFARDVNLVRADPDIALRFREVELKDGRTVEYFGNGIKGESGAAMGRIWFFRDITERKRAAAALAQSEARFKAIFDNAQDGIALTDPDTKKFLLGNAYLCRMLGYTAEEFAGLGISDIHPAESMAAVINEFERHQRGDRRPANDIPVKRKDGSLLYVDINSAPVELDGKPYILGVFRNATGRREAEEAVRKSEERYRGLVESTTDYIWETDANGCYTYYTPAITKLLGYEPGEVVGKTPFDLMPPAEAERVGKEFAAIAVARRPFSMLENTVVAKDGTEVVMETSGVPIFGKDGEFRGYRGIERDITQRKAVERAIEQRDALLHAVAVSATGLVTAASIDEAIPSALATVGEALRVDRVIVLERPPVEYAAPLLRYVWQAAGIKIRLDRAFFEDPLLVSPDIAVWRKPLSAGQVVRAERRTATGDLKKLMGLLGNESTLIVPVTVDGKFWGQIGFDSCRAPREWRDSEIEILTTLGDLIGNAIQRDRYVTEISNANRIVQNTPTVLYRLRGVPSLPMIYISQNVKLFGYEPAALTESPHLYQDLIHTDDIAGVREKQARSLESDDPRGVFEFRLMTASGNYRWVENRYSQIRDAAGRLTEIEGLLIDVTERKVAEEKIAHLARTDPLTGLANRNTFVERLRRTFVDARRGAPPFALLYIDLDRFKDINDTLGHPVGDSFLIEVSRRINKTIRATDVAGRLGGDEFAVLQSEIAESADAGTLAEKIRDALAEPYHVDGNALHITASIGIAVYDPETKTPEDMLAQADIALYRAKEEGRDQYRFHTEELDIEVREQVELTSELRGALSRGEFRLVYQPQVELSSGRIVGMEALIRWQHPTRGLLSPAAFLAVADRTGTIGAIGRWVLDEACRQMHQWRQAGCAPATIAVNISPAEIKAGEEFIAFVRATLAKWDMAPQDLELDVTESMLARATLTQNDVLERLQQIGVKISIDDFGTKYSSLDYLRTYRVNRLKIPQALTSTAARMPENAAMVRAIVGIARELGIEVIAQGVESEREWAFLTATSPVAKVQGYYYSEPVSAERAVQLLRGGRLTPARRDTAGATTRSENKNSTNGWNYLTLIKIILA